jgi:hypothetical protein
MGEYQQKNLKLEQETFDEWERYVEDSLEFSNMTQLIRVAVYQYMNDSGGSVDLEGLDFDEIDELSDEVNEVREEMRNLSNRIDTIVSKEEETIENAAQDILKVVEGEEFIQAGEVINEVDYDDFFLVRDTLEFLVDNVSFVQKEQKGLNVVYYDSRKREEELKQMLTDEQKEEWGLE